MSFGKCALCHLSTKLKRSHAIPNSIFKKLFSKDSGKAIKFMEDENTEIAYSNDSWWEFQLCEECEKLVNLCYEKYSISTLRGLRIQYSQCDDGIILSQCNNQVIISFLTSIIWRAANSDNKAYGKIYISSPENESIRTHLHAQKKISQNIVTVKLTYLFDKTVDGFTTENLKEFIISPFTRKHDRNTSFCFVLEGFFVELFIPGIPVKDRSRLGIIKPNSNYLFIPYLDIFDIPEISKLFAAGFRKNIEILVPFENKHTI